MTTSGLKSEIHKAIDEINDPVFLKAVFTILSEKLVKPEVVLTTEQEAELDKRIEANKRGESKSYSWPEAKKLIKSRMKK